MFSSTKKNIGTKFVLSALIISLVIPGALFLNPKKAEAIPVLEVNPILVGHDQFDFSKEIAFDAIAYVIAKVVISSMINSITTWVQSGFSGGPAFVQDPASFFKRAGDQIAGVYIEEIAPFLCEPFRANVQQSLSFRYSVPYFERIDCTLTDVIENVEGFFDGDFSQGGWDEWFVVTQNTANYPRGTYLLAEEGLTTTLYGIRQNEQSLLDWAGGFLSLRDAEGNVLTPGVLIEDQLSNVFGSGIRQLELADELNELVVALVATLVNQLLTGSGGLLGL